MSRARSFSVYLLLTVLINGLVKPFYLFGIDRVVQNRLPEGEYGWYFELFSLAFLLQIVNDFGLQQYNHRHIAQHRHLFAKYFPALLSMKMLLGAVYLLLVGILGLVMGYPIRWWPLLGLVAASQMMASVVLFLRGNISGLGRYGLDAVFSVLDKVLMIIGAGALLLWTAGTDHFRVEWFAAVQLIAYIISALLAMWVLWPHLGGLRGKLDLNKPLTMSILRQAYPFALAVLLMSLYTRLDAIMLGRMLQDGNVQVDLYASAYRLLDAFNLLGFLAAGLLLPMFSRLLSQNLSIHPLINQSRRWLWSAVIPVAVGCSFYAQEIMELSYTSGGAYSGKVLVWLMIALVAISLGYVYGTALVASGRLLSLNSLLLGGVVVNTALNLWLIPHQGAIGAAIATAVTQVMVLLGQMTIVGRRWSLPLQGGAWLRMAASLIISLTAVFTAEKIGLDWRWGLLMMGAISGVSALALGLLKREDLIAISPGHRAS